jgi:hypothetical protein
MWNIGEGLIEHAKLRDKRLVAVNVKRRTELLGQLGHRNTLGVERAPLVSEMIHILVLPPD